MSIHSLKLCCNKFKQLLSIRTIDNIHIKCNNQNEQKDSEWKKMYIYSSSLFSLIKGPKGYVYCLTFRRVKLQINSWREFYWRLCGNYLTSIYEEPMILRCRKIAPKPGVFVYQSLYTHTPPSF